VNANEPWSIFGISKHGPFRAATFTKSVLKEKANLKMTITNLNFKRIAGHAFGCAAMLAVSIGTLQAQAPASAPTPAKSTLAIHITGFRNAEGKVNIELFRDGKGFPLDPAGVVESERLEIDPKTLSATAMFADLRQGTYAVVVVHDDNLTGKMEFDAGGIPLKGCGFSNNPNTSQGPPTPDSAKFAVNQPEVKIEINLVYFQ
jgi:uncharacterized protein (DUF2141 family)